MCDFTKIQICLTDTKVNKNIHKNKIYNIKFIYLQLYSQLYNLITYI